MLVESQRILELDTLLSQLLSFKDSDFTKFLNSDPKTVLKPFLNCLQAFASTAQIGSGVENEISFGLHEKIFKFLLRLCPSKATEDVNTKTECDDKMIKLKPVICPKRFAEILFEADPLSLVTYLYTTWNPSKYLDLIRDELVPTSLIKNLSLKANDSSDLKVIEFFKWITKGHHGSSLKTTEKESILKRFEYESDDDYFEDEEVEEEESFQNSFDPIQAILFETFINSPVTFSRTSDTRKSPQRLKLLSSTKLSHEQLEGWALMLERNPKRSNLIQNYIVWRTAKR